MEIARDPNFDSSRYHTALAIPVMIDPPGMSRNWTPESAVEMHPLLWDALPPDEFYRSLVRGENLAFNWTDGWEPMPRHATLDAMIRFDERFKADYKRAEMRFRVLDGYASSSGTQLAGEACHDSEVAIVSTVASRRGTFHCLGLRDHLVDWADHVA